MKAIFSIFHLILIAYCGNIVVVDAELKFILDAVKAEKEAEDVGKVRFELDKSEDVVKISGEAEQFVDLDNSWKVKILLKGADDANDEYKNIMKLPVLGVCDFMKFYYKMFLYQSLVKYSNAPLPSDCPVVKNTYILKEYPLATDIFKKYLRSGFYIVELVLYHEDEEKLKYRIEGHIKEE